MSNPFFFLVPNILVYCPGLEVLHPANLRAQLQNLDGAVKPMENPKMIPSLLASQRMSVVAKLRIIRQGVVVANQPMLLQNHPASQGIMILLHRRLPNPRMKATRRPPSPSKKTRKLESQSWARRKRRPLQRIKPIKVVGSPVLMALAK